MQTKTEVRPFPGSTGTTVMAEGLVTFRCEHCRKLHETYSRNQIFCKARACQAAKRERDLKLKHIAEAKRKRRRLMSEQ